MPKTRVIIVLGILVALLPVLGFPRSWEAFFQVLAGLSIVVLSVWSTIDKKLMLKAKAQQRIAKKASLSPGPSDPLDSQANQTGEALKSQGLARRVTDFYPRTAPPGRRLSDINPTLEPPKEGEI